MKKADKHEDKQNRKIFTSPFKRSLWDKAVVFFIATGTITLAIVNLVTNVFGNWLEDKSQEFTIGMLVIGILSVFYMLLSLFFDGKFKKSQEYMVAGFEQSHVNTVESVKEQVESVKEQILQIHNIYQALTSENKEIVRYAYREVEDLSSKLSDIVRYGYTMRLDVEDYYLELEYIADKLLDDDSVTSDNSFVWAMTAFSSGEWDQEGNKNEEEWCAKMALILAKGIPTKRICCISRELKEYLQNQDPSSIANKSYYSLVAHLKEYYSETSKYRGNVVHYVLEEDTDNESLRKFSDSAEKGFFGISITKEGKNEKYLVAGEAVNFTKGMTGRLFFTQEVIKKDYDVFDQFVTRKSTSELIAYLQKVCNKNILADLRSKKICI